MDEELRRELLARADDDASPGGQSTAGRADHAAALPRKQPVDHEVVAAAQGGALQIQRGEGQRHRPARREDGAQAAWLLAQHADRDLDLQRAFLDALRGAVGEGEAAPANLAYLEDRVRVADGRPQLYGTQFTVTEREFGPCPIEDPQRLDERRAAVGLEPFADYEAQIRGHRTQED